MTTIQESYSEHVNALRQLGSKLSAAVSIRYEPPPGTPRSKEGSAESTGVRNPTLDVVMDPRRMAVSDAISSADTALRHATAQLRTRIDALQQATAAWEGQEGPSQ